MSLAASSSSYPLLNIFWTMFIFFLWVIWIWLLIMVFIDIFRSRDLSGWAKALWFLFVLFILLIGVLVYLIARVAAPCMSGPGGMPSGATPMPPNWAAERSAGRDGRIGNDHDGLLRNVCAGLAPANHRVGRIGETVVALEPPLEEAVGGDTTHDPLRTVGEIDRGRPVARVPCARQSRTRRGLTPRHPPGGLPDCSIVWHPGQGASPRWGYLGLGDLGGRPK